LLVFLPVPPPGCPRANCRESIDMTAGITRTRMSDSNSWR
jgi:hypothetical protein